MTNVEKAKKTPAINLVLCNPSRSKSAFCPYGLSVHSPDFRVLSALAVILPEYVDEM